MKFNFNKMNEPTQFLFLTLGRAACYAKKNTDMPKDHWMQFCEGMWETMEMNGYEKFDEILADKMMGDLKKFMEEAKAEDEE